MYLACTDWCTAEGIDPVSEEHFANGMKERGLQKKKTKQGRFYLDCQLKGVALSSPNTVVPKILF
jgi:hypothetical protein